MKMHSLCAALLAAMVVLACGDTETSEDVDSASTPESTDAVDPCEWLTVPMVEAEFPAAEDITQELDAGPNPMCDFTFSAGDRDYVLGLTIAPDISGGQETLESMVSRFDDTTPIEDLGDAAYYVGSPANQVSVLIGDNIFHLGLRHGLTGDREKAVALARRVVEKLN